MKVQTFSNAPNHYAINCPACGHLHVFDERWTFNGDFNKPTFRNSLLVRTGVHAPGYTTEGKTPEELEDDRRHSIQCHSYVTDGFIAYENDSSHEMKGQTVELPEFVD